MFTFNSILIVLVYFKLFYLTIKQFWRILIHNLSFFIYLFVTDQGTLSYCTLLVLCIFTTFFVFILIFLIELYLFAYERSFETKVFLLNFTKATKGMSYLVNNLEG